MNTPVNFEIAKLLKEKGFDNPCENRYNELGELTATKLGMNMQPNNYSDSYSAPTIAETVMWLYEKHGIWISVDPENDTDTWFHTVSHNKSETVFGDYTSPTEAYEAAIEYVLNNLI